MHNASIKLEINFTNDLRYKFLDQLRNAGYPFNKKASIEYLTRQYLTILYREIAPRVRRIHISDQLRSRELKSHIRDALGIIIHHAATGMHLNHYLSRELLNPDYKDMLLFDWGIHHLHLSINQDPKNPAFIERTKDLLFVRVEPEDFYCIDVLDHDLVKSFSNRSLLEIIRANWPRLLEKSKIKGIVGLSQTVTDADIHFLRKGHVNTIIELSDGYYFSPGGGYATDGSSVLVTRQTDWLLSMVRWAESSIKNNERIIRGEIVRMKGHCPPTLQVKLRAWDESGADGLERKTNTKLRMDWKRNTITIQDSNSGLPKSLLYPS